MVEISAPSSAVSPAVGSNSNSRWLNKKYVFTGVGLVLLLVFSSGILGHNNNSNKNGNSNTDSGRENDTNRHGNRPSSVVHSQEQDGEQKVTTKSGAGAVVQHKKHEKSEYKHYQSQITLEGGKIRKGNIDQVSYYTCLAHSSIHDLDVHDIVLLHGGKYQKEDWRTSKIIQTLCETPHVQVTALNLNPRASYTDLEKVLDGLVTHRILSKLPIQALVTPSLSGQMIVRALQQDKLLGLQRLMTWWVPIASESVLELTAQQLAPIKNAKLRGGWRIWSVHGQDDAMGVQVSQKLQQEAGATVQEFAGGHVFYLQAPQSQEFCQALVQHLGDVQTRLRRYLRRLWTATAESVGSLYSYNNSNAPSGTR